MDEVQQCLISIEHALNDIALFYRELKKPPIDEIIVANATTDIVVSTRDRKYNMILSPVSNLQIVADMPGIGAVTFTLNLGWNETDFSTETRLKLASGTQSLLYRCTNTPLGANVI